MALDPSSHVAATFSPRGMGDAEVAQRLRASLHTEAALKALLGKKAITQDDVVRTLHASRMAGVMTEEETGHMFNSLPKDPQHLRAVLTHLLAVAQHAGTLLKSEMHHRQPSGAA